MSHLPLGNNANTNDDDAFVNAINELHTDKLAKTGDTVTPASIVYPTETVAATNVITAEESGTTYFLSHATEFVSTLPAPAAGLKYTFIVANAPETDSYTIVTNSSANVIFGAIASSDGAATAASAGVGADTITFVDGAADIGDRVELISDGTNWYATGFCGIATAITFQTVS